MLDMLEVLPLYRIAGEEIDMVALAARAEDPEHAVDLAEIAGQREEIVAIPGKARPLRPVLLRRVPQEGIADRRVGHGDILGDEEGRRRADVHSDQPVADHADRVE